MPKLSRAAGATIKVPPFPRKRPVIESSRNQHHLFSAKSGDSSHHCYIQRLHHGYIHVDSGRSLGPRCWRDRYPDDHPPSSARPIFSVRPSRLRANGLPFPIRNERRSKEGTPPPGEAGPSERTNASERAHGNSTSRSEAKRGETTRDARRETRHGKCTVERARERGSAGARGREDGWEVGGLRSGRGEGKRAFIIAVRFCHTPGARARNSALPGIANTNFGTRQRRPKFTNEISELAGKMWDRAARSISRKISGGQQERD